MHGVHTVTVPNVNFKCETRICERIFYFLLMRRAHGQLTVATGCQEWAEKMRFAPLQLPEQSPACPSISFLAINHGPSAEQKAGGRRYRKVLWRPSGYSVKLRSNLQLIH
jgi:hypothetical protein